MHYIMKQREYVFIIFRKSKEIKYERTEIWTLIWAGPSGGSGDSGPMFTGHSGPETVSSPYS